MNAKELKFKITTGEKINLLDLRKKEDYDVFHIESAKWVDINDLVQNPDKYINKEEQTYLICYTGNSAGAATMMLNAKGYKTENIDGGMSSIS